MNHPADNTTQITPWVRSGAMVGIINFLESAGIAPETVVGKDWIRLMEAADPYRKVDLVTILQTFQKAAETAAKPDICLELGLNQHLEDWGPFGFLFLNAPTIGEALKDLCRYGVALQGHAQFQLSNKGDLFAIEYTSNHPELSGFELDVEITICFFMSIVNGLRGKVVYPKRIYFEHQPLHEAKLYRKSLGVTPQFRASSNAVHYPKNVLQHPIPGANPKLYKVLKRHIRDLAEAEKGEDQLINIVRNNIGRGLTQGTATLEHIAAEIGLEPRTLQRRLKEESTSFHALTDEVRLSRASYFLEKTRLSITDISLELGYAETSGFVRSFKRMTDLSPSQYRQQRQP